MRRVQLLKEIIMIKAVILIGGPMKGKNVLLPECKSSLHHAASHVTLERRHVNL